MEIFLIRNCLKYFKDFKYCLRIDLTGNANGDFSDKKLFDFSIIGGNILSHSNYYLPVSD